jgi:hypothetical protein
VPLGPQYGAATPQRPSLTTPLFPHDSRLPMYKTILVIWDTPHHTQESVWNLLHFVYITMVIALLWAQLVVCVFLKAQDLFLQSQM